MTPGRAESLRVHSAVLPILGAEGAILAILIVLLSVLLASVYNFFSSSSY